jgi:predicted enzyme related to lactoylglutathione lyase
VPAYIVMDTQMPERLVEFYTELQGVEVLLAYDDGRYHALAPNREGLIIVLQRVPEAKQGKNRAHFDVVVDDLEGPTQKVLDLGGSWREPGKTHELEGFSWRCMADPEGNEFCLYLMAPGMNNDAQPAPS